MPMSLLLRCLDLAQTRAFYASLPGFGVRDSAEHTLTVEHDGCRLLFTAQDLWNGPPALSGTLYMDVTDVAGLYAAVKDSAPIAWPLQTMPYGSTEFAITDCNGYLLAFQQRR